MKNFRDLSFGVLIFCLANFFLAGCCAEGKICCGGTKDCPSGQRCVDGYCVDHCEGVECPEGMQCYMGSCFTTFDCEEHCPEGEICSSDGLDCVPDPCFDVTCREGEVCVQGSCFITSNCEEGCPEGEICSSDGLRCVPDLCIDVTCPEGEVCVQGSCFLEVD